MKLLDQEMLILKENTKYKDYTGKTINGYEILEYIGHRKNCAYHNVRCPNCKNECVKRISSLKYLNGTCQLCKSLRGSKSSNWKGYGEICKELWNYIKWGASSRKLEFEISIEYAWNLFLKQNRKCALSGWNLKFDEVFNHRTRTASLDRIDSAKGYIEGNVQWVHRNVNCYKSNMTEEALFNMCKAICLHRELINHKDIDSCSITPEPTICKPFYKVASRQTED